MKRRMKLLIALLVVCQGVFAQQKVSILGDSYSTFGGYVTPATNLCWYGGTDGKGDNNVKKVEQTWWYLLTSSPEYALDTNNSYSGSTVCYTGYRKEDYSDRAFITRMNEVGEPDVLLIFGGTNDSWAGAPIGEYQYSDWQKADLYQFRPAFCYLLHYVITHYPKARILNITNSELKPEVTESMAEVCRHYGVQNLLLQDIEKQWGHPSIKGMQAICAQVKAALNQTNE